MRISSLSWLCLVLTGCVTERATHGALPKERATECVAHCASLDMKLSAVVIMKSAAGCVCVPKEGDGQASTAEAGASAAAGALIAVEEEKQQAAPSQGGGRSR